MDYKKSLNLPSTKFPMKANLPNLEPELLDFWKEIDLYNKMIANRKDAKTFILHDGPPYANGHIHLGTTFNKILKDFIVKYKNLRGFRTPYIPGWDCHGMPIEHNVTKNLGEKAKQIEKTVLRKKCRYYADKFVNIQKEEFKRLGVFGDWEHPYITMSKEYESAIIDNFGKMVEKGYIYRGLRPIHWCSKCQTALAGNEIEYEDKTSPSIFVKFKIDNKKSFIIWTTTPWTLPANVAIAMHPNENYVEIETDKGILIIAEKLKNVIEDKLNLKITKLISVKKASEYQGEQYFHPIYENKKGKVILADYVTMETGSGIVHIAPGHGYDDYQVGVKYNLDIISPVNKEGKFTDEVKKYEGQFVFDANKNIINDLQKNGVLLLNENITHSYPVCWRCKSELIFRATEQWFLSVEHNNLRDQLKKQIENVKWIPQWSKDRIYNMVEIRPDWCLSRQRSWGVPIPVVYCKNCGEPVLDKSFIDKIRDIIAEEGSDIWFEKDVKFFTKELKCKKCGSTNFEKETNIFDVWFDSALSHDAVVKKRKELDWPSDLYLEAVDQHRGWFQVSLIVSTATEGAAPYREVLTHGLILDKNMKKMSKSLGNVVSPEKIWKKYGAEILRLWFASIDYTSDAPFGEELLKGATDVYRRVRNTIKFILGNLNDFDYKENRVEVSDMLDIDKYILHRLYLLKERVFKYYDEYQFHKVFRDYHYFCSNELSSFYLDIIKDRLYTYKKDSIERRSGQTAMYIILDYLLKIIAPILPFTAEQSYKYFNKNNKKESIHLEIIDNFVDQFKNETINEEWKELKKIREFVNAVLERIRNNNTIGKSLEAKILIYSGNAAITEILQKHIDFLPQIFIVSKVEIFEEHITDAMEKIEELDIEIKAEKADGEKCSRCWIYSEEVGADSEFNDLCKKCIDAVKSEV